MDFHSVIKKNEILSFADRWMELENIRLARFRQPKAICFLSHEEYRFKTNISNIVDAYKYMQNIYPKMKPVESVPRREGERIKEKDGGGESN
jgi:hypothetical protein